MPNLPLDDDVQQLKEALPLRFQDDLLAEIPLLTQAFPLLSMICEDRELITRLAAALEISKPRLTQELVKTLVTRFQALEGQFCAQSRFKYRLPVVLSEFPIHSRAINQSIQTFNEAIESLYQGYCFFDPVLMEDNYQAILSRVAEHGCYCDSDSLWQLLGMLGGWSNYSVAELLQIDTDLIAASSSEDGHALSEPEPIPLVSIQDLEQPQTIDDEEPFIPDYNYSINQAGRLAKETYVLLLNAFGMKIGGHFDAQVKYVPQFIPVTFFHTLVRRQLSHRLDLWPTKEFEYWTEVSLHRLGLSFIQKDHTDFSTDLLLNPFFSNPISFLSPEKIQGVLIETLNEFDYKELNPTPSELKLLAHYFFELLQAFQFNPGQALGIGANWDGTVNLSNESGTEAFRFTNASWGRRFKNLSLHRQGPSEARMNAGIGIKVELKTLLSNFNYMSQLQISEYPEVLYNALIDNLVTELLPEPAYFENTRYPKHRKQHIIQRNAEGLARIVSFIEPSEQGTYFKDRLGQVKQTPMYRRAGTLDVQAFPRNTTYSEQSRHCYDGNPLGPMQVQFAQGLHQHTRGHIVYDPIAPDQFLEDPFFGQVLRSDNGDFSPFIGVMPTNYDRHLEQKPELCASFVIRMLQSARIMEYCPTFRATFEQIKTCFLPLKSTQGPELPAFCSSYILAKKMTLDAELTNEERSFTRCHKAFHSLFKNLVYSLYDIGRRDPHFQQTFLEFIHSADLSNASSRANYDKVIRDLRINRPVYLPAEALARFDAIICYLIALNTYFYPHPEERLLQKMVQSAKMHIDLLFNSRAIQNYFRLQRENKASNLSRQHTPGMLHSALKYKGPSQSVARDYGHMHNMSFPSYYRDADGTPNGEPQWIDRVIDRCAKTLGASLQTLHRYNLFGLIHAPLSAPILCAREQAAKHRDQRLKPLWMLGGALQGFFWDGIITGLWQTTTTPFLMLADFCSWQFQWISQQEKTQIDNPLGISAAPANEASLRTLASAQTRDFLLYLLDKKEETETKKTLILGYSLDKIRMLYPYLEELDLELCHQLMEQSFSMADEEWIDLFNPLLNNSYDIALSQILQSNNSCINKPLTQAVFRCITSPQSHTPSQTIIKETVSFFTLNARQAEVLKKIFALYQQGSVAVKQQFFDYFRLNGPIHSAIKRRDRYLQRLQSHILHIFDEQWILEFLFNARIHELIDSVKVDNLDYIIKRLPDSMKGPLIQSLNSNDLHELNHYDLNDSQRGLLFKIHQLLIHDESSLEKQISLATALKLKPQSSWLSLKELAHNKCARFIEQELKHELLSIEEVKEIIHLIKIKAPAFANRLNTLFTLYQNLHSANNQQLDEFYEFALILKNEINAIDARILLLNLINTTMNRLINARLAGLPLSEHASIENPLLGSIAIESWLNQVYQHEDDFRSLLKQQLYQTPSIDHALLRDQCILQVLEQQDCNEKINKTNLQALLRFWIQHRDNVTMTGERYYDSRTGSSLKGHYATLFQGSKTLQFSINRVQEKLADLCAMGNSRKLTLPSP